MKLLTGNRGIVVAAAALLMVVAPAAGLGLAMHTVGSQARSIEGLRAEVHALQSNLDSQPDWPAIARHAEPSVFTAEPESGSGSGGFARPGDPASRRVTNFQATRVAWSA